MMCQQQQPALVKWTLTLLFKKSWRPPWYTMALLVDCMKQLKHWTGAANERSRFQLFAIFLASKNIFSILFNESTQVFWNHIWEEIIPGYLIEQNRTKNQSNSIERLGFVRLVIEQNRTCNKLWLWILNQLNKIYATEHNQVWFFLVIEYSIEIDMRVFGSQTFNNYWNWLSDIQLTNI